MGPDERGNSSASVGTAAMVAVAAAACPPAELGNSRTELMILNHEFREIYRSASLRADGSSTRGRKTKHDTATRRWIDTVGLPGLAVGKLPDRHDLAMLRSGPRSALSGTFLAARDAWSQLHARDPRSKQLTGAEKCGQQTLLAWARTNTPDALTRSTAQRGRPESYTLHFGLWQGWTLRQLISLAAGSSWALAHAMTGAKAGSHPADYLAWLFGSTFRMQFPFHFYLYLGLKEIEAEVRALEMAEPNPNPNPNPNAEPEPRSS